MTEPTHDAIARAFESIRMEAKKRNGRVPDLSRQGKVPKSTPKRGGRPIGKPTGPDGRSTWQGKQAVTFGSVLQTEIQRRGWHRELAGGWVHSNWDQLVGGTIAQHTKVEMLKEKTLHISCDSTAWATNLRMMQRNILQTIAQRVGPDVVVELRIYGPQVPSWRKGRLHIQGRGPRDTYG
ncbi:MAG: DciA family protein [Corynebacterium sp.]|nr:DciA family protein [Corynebacterium sp.]